MEPKEQTPVRQSPPESDRQPEEPFENRSSILDGNSRHHPMMLPLFTILMLLLVLSSFSLIRQQPRPAPPTQPTAAVTEPSLPPLPADCFSMEEGRLRFHPELLPDTPVLILPDSVGGIPVLELPEDCFSGLTGVTTLVLPQGLREIGPRAFAGCRDLRGICLPSTVVAVGDEAFRGCQALEAVYVPLGVQSIGPRAFAECASLHFIFYSGFHRDWTLLCDEFITPFTLVSCLDGEFSHAAG